MNAAAELRLERSAGLDAPKVLRHVLAALLEALGVGPERRGDIIVAVGEALSNAVEHAYTASEPGTVALQARSTGADLLVEVADRGTFIERPGTPGRGLGLTIARAIAREVTVDQSNGTRIAMRFDLTANSEP